MNHDKYVINEEIRQHNQDQYCGEKGQEPDPKQGTDKKNERDIAHKELVALE